MHRIQTEIIYRLAVNSNLRFSKLKPDYLESNQFMYHLKTLMADGLVEKVGEYYQLTPSGAQYVSKLSFETLATRTQPRVDTMIYVENAKNEQLLYKINRQPLLGKISFVHGKLHYGETISQAAERELKEKTGLSAKLNYKGNIYIRTYSDKDLIHHIFYHVFVGTNPTGKLSTHPRHGESFWGNYHNFPTTELQPGLDEIVDLVKSTKNGIFKEIDVYL